MNNRNKAMKNVNKNSETKMEVGIKEKMEY